MLPKNKRAVKHYLSFFALFLFMTMPGKAQPAIDSVKSVVNNLFTAMKNSDTVLLKSCFTLNSILQTVARHKDGTTAIENETLHEFALSVSGQAKGSLDEQIVFDLVKADGSLATVWAPYYFYYNGKFLHCGVNSFQLVKLSGEWKIQYLIDTRRKDGCDNSQ